MVFLPFPFLPACRDSWSGSSYSSEEGLVFVVWTACIAYVPGPLSSMPLVSLSIHFQPVRENTRLNLEGNSEKEGTETQIQTSVSVPREAERKKIPLNASVRGLGVRSWLQGLYGVADYKWGCSRNLGPRSNVSRVTTSQFHHGAQGQHYLPCRTMWFK